MSQRTDALADRLEQGSRALASFASALTDAEWHTRVPKDGRKIGRTAPWMLRDPLESRSRSDAA